MFATSWDSNVSDRTLLQRNRSGSDDVGLGGRSNPTCAESYLDHRQINALAGKLALHLCGLGSGALFESWQVVLGEAHALWQGDAETVEESGLCRVWLSHAAQANLAVRCRRQDDVVGLNALDFFQDGARRITETRAALPHLQGLPQNEGKKADEDVSLHAILALVPDRTDIELILLNSKSGFGLCELDIGFPKLLIAPIANVRTQQIGAL